MGNLSSGNLSTEVFWNFGILDISALGISALRYLEIGKKISKWGLTNGSWGARLRYLLTGDMMEAAVNMVAGILVGSMLAIGAVEVGEALAQLLIRRDARKRNRA